MSRHDRLESLFLECAAFAPEQREALLDLRCAGDPELKAEVLDLLGRDTDPHAPSLPPFVEHPGPALRPDDPPPLPDTIGPYRVVRRLGEGGFGEVFEAEQDRPVRRRVALKVLKPGMDSRAVLARFAAERQTLALMDHPGVARVLDAGETEQGRPYFAMELVDGEPITEWCDRTGAGRATRVELMIAVCRAVAHAHQKGVIHRDLKPTNILVAESDGRPLPKVIDFGIAKATLSVADGASLHTRPGEILGTPEYMSPEQAASGGVDVDTRTDVYSLGAVLYRLLTGRLPFDSDRLREAGLEEVRRILVQEEPPRPSTLGGTSRSLRGDLDWIILRAMDKERSRRYASPALLADDLGRHLHEEPVLAGPPTLGYRLWKLARRRRGAVVAALVVVVALAAGVAATAIQAIRATRAEEEARRQAETALAVNRFLTEMLEAGNPRSNPGGYAVTVREILDRAASGLGDSTFANPAVEAGIRAVLASTYLGLGLYAQAVPLARRAVELTDRSTRVSAATRLERIVLLALAEALAGERQAAESRLATIARQMREPEADVALRSRYLQVRGGNLGSMDRLEEADSLLTESVALRRERFRAGAPFGGLLAGSLWDLSEVKARRGSLDESDTLVREAVDVVRATRRNDHHDVAQSLAMLGSVRRRQGRYADAESLYRAAIAIDRRVLGPRHEFIAASLSNLGLVLGALGRPREAEAAHREALDILRASGNGAGTEAVKVLNNVAASVQGQGRLAEAVALQLQTLTLARQLGMGPTSLATYTNNLAAAYRLQKRYDEAAPLFREADSLISAVRGPAEPAGVIARYNLGKILLDQRRWREAEPHLREASQRAAAAFPPGHPNAVVIRSGLGRACVALGRTAEAESLLLDAHAKLSAALGPRHERTRYAADGLAVLYRKLGRAGEASRWRAAAEAGAR